MVLSKAIVFVVLGSFLTHPQALSFPETNNPCNPSPCGANAVCKVNNQNSPTCECLPNFVNAPPNCQPECIMNSNCTTDMSCINLRCRDPCPGLCGLNAVCQTTNHSPSCKCLEGHMGDPFRQCAPVPPATSAPETKNVSDCSKDSDCPNQMGCLNLRCRDPCPGSCGLKATCFAINHRPICSCTDGLTGDAFTECTPITGIASTSTANESTGCVIHKDCPVNLECLNQKCNDPCGIYGLCGPNASCQVEDHTPICKCPQGYQGNPFIQCTPIPSDTSCLIHEDCPVHLECLSKKCHDPCGEYALCGLNASCVVDNHVSRCKCPQGHQGDPFNECVPIPPSTPSPSTTAADVVKDPCVPFPCGPNARCNNGVCTNITEYVGVPYESCTPGCDLSSDCPLEQACLRSKCSDPCPGTCGDNAKCTVVNHIPVCTCLESYIGDAFTGCRHVVKRSPFSPFQPCSPSPCGANSKCRAIKNAGSCSCLEGYTGDPYEGCRQVVKRTSFSPFQPCEPSPCGPNSQCKVINDHALCSCLEGFVGRPPSCRAECKLSTDCLQTKACVDQKCVDPCQGACGKGAHCEVINHGAICSCRAGQSGDPCRRCSDITSPEPRLNPCEPPPCGANALCTIINGNPICSCFANFFGSPPNCRPECVLSKDCPQQLACINQRCRDPCPGACGTNATCLTSNHIPVCSCIDGHIGDPFFQCSLISDNSSESVTTETSACVLSKDCPSGKACLRSKCGDPCPGTCGNNAKCNVVDHNPICTCPDGYNGDPFVACKQVAKRAAYSVINPCSPSPCGPNSQCRNIGDHGVCSCLKGFVGTPPSCRAECAVSADCPPEKACVSNKCADPCLGTCGQGASCAVVKHNPICSCPEGRTGDPFRSCQ